SYSDIFVVSIALFCWSCLLCELPGRIVYNSNATRVWERAEELELSRVVFVNMLDRERADFFRVLASVQEQLSERCVAIQLPIGSEHELTGIVDLLHNCAYMDPAGAREGDPVAIPDQLAGIVEEYRTKLLDAVVETDEALMERYRSEERRVGKEGRAR